MWWSEFQAPSKQNILLQVIISNQARNHNRCFVVLAVFHVNLLVRLEFTLLECTKTSKCTQKTFNNILKYYKFRASMFIRVWIFLQLFIVTVYASKLAMPHYFRILISKKMSSAFSDLTFQFPDGIQNILTWSRSSILGCVLQCWMLVSEHTLNVMFTHLEMCYISRLQRFPVKLWKKIFIYFCAFKGSLKIQLTWYIFYIMAFYNGRADWLITEI